MLDPDEKKLLAKGMLTINIIWGAMLFSLVSYLFICHRLKENMQPGVSADFPLALFRNLLLLVSAGAFFVAVFMRGTLLKVKPGDASATSPQLSQSQQHPATGRYLSAIIVSLALSESIGIYGLVIWFMSMDFQSLYLFVSISAFAMIYFRPKMEELTNLTKAMKRWNP